MAESQKKQWQDEAGISQFFSNLPANEMDDRTVISTTTDSQTIDGEEQTQVDENNTAADEATETDEVTEIHAPPPTAIANRTLTTDTPMPTSSIGCCTAISTRINGRDPTATPTSPSDTTLHRSFNSTFLLDLSSSL